jgi:hypothetical protein
VVAIPPRAATDSYLERMGRKTDISFDVDLGEIVRGHHVVARGIELARSMNVYKWLQEIETEREMGWQGQAGPALRSTFSKLSAEDMEVVGTRLSEPQLHYEFVPGLEVAEDNEDHFFWYWMLHVSDDVGTEYRDDNNGTRGPAEGGVATHATRDLGGDIPDSASRLVIEFDPPSGWEPPEPWRHELVIDLVARQVIE